MLREQIQAIRASAAAQVAMADAILKALAPPETISASGGQAAGEHSGVCRHPEESRLAAPRMGAPTAWVCARCGVTGDAVGDDAPIEKEA